ncbi:rhomboid family intramembrane serine protease [Oleiphilus sp. HI0125]|uniref:rhomboid family intramembrane serine protease n=1 Tax=Oleiphilus sp. HI0125 TaxID=1822266 RepID=UPI0009EDB512
MSQTKFSYIFVVLLCISIQIFGLTTTLQYDGSTVFEGQYWRLISAHFSHLTWLHLSQNMAALLLLVYLLPCLKSIKTLNLVFVISGIAITGMDYLFILSAIHFLYWLKRLPSCPSGFWHTETDI